VCSPLKVNRRFGGICRLHLQGRRISHARKRYEAGSKQSNRLVEISVYVGSRRELEDSKSFPLTPSRTQSRERANGCGEQRSEQYGREDGG
jgi:hypothetical protein